MTPAEFKTLREFLGLSAQWLADTVHVDQRTVRRWEDGAIPLRADVIDVLTRLNQRADTELAANLNQIATDIGTATADLNTTLRTRHPDHWPTKSIPRVDADVTDEPSLPASWFRALAARLHHALGGRLHLTYRSPGATS